MQVKARSKRQSAGRRGNRSQIISEINITPFVDVMLVLLIIFMVSAPMLIGGVNVDLPSNSAANNVNPDPFVVSITREGKIFLDKDEVKLKDIKKIMPKYVKDFEAKIHIKGDRTVDYGQIMKVIAEINKAGYKKVSLITDVSK